MVEAASVRVEASSGQELAVRRDSNGTASAAGPETLFFVHVPKCAGSSFRQVLKRWFGHQAVFIDTHDPRALAAAVGELDDPPRAVAGHIPFGLHEGLGLTPCYAALVRDPLDRFVSFHQHARRTPDHPMHRPAAALDVEAFYDFTLRDPRAAGQTRGVQCYFLSRERTFAAARTAVDRFALAAPTTRYDDFVRALAERLGRQAPELRPRNVGDGRADSDAARARLQPRIAADHAEDMALFTYVSDTFDARRARLLSAATA